MVDQDQKVEAKKSSILKAQLLALTWILVGTVGIYLINPLYGWLYLAFAAFSVYIIARRFMCTSCYYCKSCTKGVAKLSIMFLGGNNIPGLGKSTVIGLNVFLYVVLTVIPGALLTLALLQTYNAAYVAVLVALLDITAVSVAAKIKRGNKLITS